MLSLGCLGRSSVYAQRLLFIRTEVRNCTTQATSSLLLHFLYFNRQLDQTCKHWAPLVWKETTPRHATTTWLFILNRNHTFDRLALWDAEMETICLQCGEGEESHDYLFFDCSFSYVIWDTLLNKLCFSFLLPRKISCLVV
ncbi:hypothetical protein Bca4012_049830 [Brassica carinata]